MRYVSHVLRSPRLLLQLLLLLALAGLIGGAGLRGLVTAHSTLHDISSSQLPSLVHLLDAEREITQAENLGYRALLNYDAAQKLTPTEIPEIVAMIRLAWQNYQLFKEDGPHPGDQAALQSQVESRFPGLLLAASVAEPLGSAKVGSSVGLKLMQQADAQFVAPLQAQLTQLAKLDEADLTASGAASAGSVATTAALLLGVILGTLAIACIFQIAIDARGHRGRALSRQSADLVLIVDSHGTVRHASASFQQALGHQPTALVGRPLAEFVHPDDAVEAVASVNQLGEAKGATLSAALRALHADGSYRWLELVAINYVRDPLVRGIVINARDVTERREAELRLRAVLTHAPIALFALEAGGTLTYYQEGVPFIPSATAHSVVGLSISSWQANAP
jgi:PAS domain S-box-containing protein